MTTHTMDTTMEALTVKTKAAATRLVKAAAPTEVTNLAVLTTAITTVPRSAVTKAAAHTKTRAVIPIPTQTAGNAADVTVAYF